MAEREIHPSFAVHAGAWLKSEIVEPHHISINELAAAFRVSRQAVRFEHAFGVRAETLMRMQARYELARAREREDELAVERLVAA